MDIFLISFYHVRGIPEVSFCGRRPLTRSSQTCCSLALPFPFFPPLKKRVVYIALTCFDFRYFSLDVFRFLFQAAIPHSPFS
jgi:hypothetical protein